MTTTWPAKDPDEVLDYTVDWSDHLGADTIATSAFTLVTVAGLTKDSEENTDTTSTIWLSDGTAGSVAQILCRITTDGGRTHDEVISLPIDGSLTVEDGTGLAAADALVSIATVSAYADKRGLTWNYTLVQKEAAIRRASAYLTHSVSWQGYKVNARSQALAWPRTGVYDEEDELVSYTSVPQEVADACCELAIYEAANPGALSPATIAADRIKRERVGSLEVEYVGGMGSNASRPVLTLVRDMISGLVTSASSGLVGRAVRA